MRGCQFETFCRWNHFVVSLYNTFYPLISTGSTQEDHLDMTEISVDLDVKHQNKQSKQIQFTLQ